MNKETLRSLVRFKDETECPCCKGDCEYCKALLAACHDITEEDRTSERMRFAGILAGAGLLGVALVAHACLAAAPGWTFQWFEGLAGIFGAVVGIVGCYAECRALTE